MDDLIQQLEWALEYAHGIARGKNCSKDGEPQALRALARDLREVADELERLGWV